MPIQLDVQPTSRGSSTEATFIQRVKEQPYSSRLEHDIYSLGVDFSRLDHTRQLCIVVKSLTVHQCPKRDHEMIIQKIVKGGAPATAYVKQEQTARPLLRQEHRHGDLIGVRFTGQVNVKQETMAYLLDYFRV